MEEALLKLLKFGRPRVSYSDIFKDWIANIEMNTNLASANVEVNARGASPSTAVFALLEQVELVITTISAKRIK